MSAPSFDQRADEARELFARYRDLRIEQVKFCAYRLSGERWYVVVDGYGSPYETGFEADTSDAALNKLLEWLRCQNTTAQVSA
jgi:hypothetical protein